MPVRKVAFLDTMLFLHYPLFTDTKAWDWKKLLDADEVELVIPRITFNEIDHHKDKNSNGAVRKRARNAAVAIENLFPKPEAVHLEAGVTASLLMKRPKNFEAHDLDGDVPDDELILGMINRREQELSGGSNKSVVVVSGDSPVKVKARHYGFEAYGPDEAVRFNDDAETDKRIKELERKVAQLQGNAPSLGLTFIERQWDVTAPLILLNDFKDEYVRERMLKFREELPYKSHRRLGPYPTDLSYDPGVADYNERLKQYFTEAEKDLKALYDQQLRIARMFNIGLWLHNDGSAPANNVTVTLTPSGAFRFLSTEDLPEDPESPEVPYENVLAYSFPRPSRTENRRYSWDWRGSESRLELSVPKIVQHEPMSLPPFYLELFDNTAAQNCGVQVRITAEELPSPLTKRLLIRLTEPQAIPERESVIMDGLKQMRMSPREETEYHRARIEERKKR